GHLDVAGSFGSNPVITPNMIAALATSLAIGPAVSWSAEIGMTPQRLIRPVVGLIPASIVAFDGLRIDPDVSLPTFAAARLALVGVPELEPPVASAGRPSLKGYPKKSTPGLGSGLGS